jgi:putative ABC transport system permease protein
MLARLLLRLVPDRWGESIDGDLQEARAKRRAGGRRVGPLWESWFCGSIVLRLLVEARRAQACARRGRGGRRLMNSFLFELKGAVRVLSRSRSTTAIAIGVLAVTIGFSTAVFSVADGVLFKPLPYPSPDRLVTLRFTMPRFTSGISLTGAELDSARAATSVFEQVEAFNISGVASRIDGPEPERLRSGRVTPGFLPMLGARVRGEHFTREHSAGDGAPVTILTHRYWKTRMGGDPSVIGTLLRLDGEPAVRIIGVLDEDFVFPSASRSLLPQIIRPFPDAWLYDDGRGADAIGRLRPGVGLAAVPAAVPVDPSVRSREGLQITATALHERMAYSARRGLVMLFAAVLGLLLIGMLDVAGLLLVRATSREREIVTRRALGASGGRIARQLLLEALLIAAAGGALGVAAAGIAFESLLHLVPEQFRLLRPTGLDVRAMLFAGFAVLLTAVVFGLAPLVHLGRLSSASLRTGAGLTAGRHVRRLSNAIVTGQVAAAVALTLIGVLLISSFIRVRNAPVGFDTARLAYISVTPPPSLVPTRGELFRTALARLRTIEGVQEVALLDVPALRSTVRGTTLGPEGGQVPESSRLFSDTQLVVSPEYFRTAGLHLVDGRFFTDADERNASGVAMVNETLARTWFPGDRAVGRRLVNKIENRVIVGVVEDARHFSLKEPPLAEIFTPTNPAKPIYGGTFVIRSNQPREVLTPAVAALRALAPTLPITAVETGDDAVSKAAEAERFYATLLSVCAGAGLVLALVGLYGALSWSVSSRRRELGLRAALGAERRTLASSVAWQAVPVLLVGGALGAVLGWWGARLAAALLYEVSAAEPSLWLIATAIVGVSSAIAIAIPARRAFRTNPGEALRQDA